MTTAPPPAASAASCVFAAAGASGRALPRISRPMRNIATKFATPAPIAHSATRPRRSGSAMSAPMTHTANSTVNGAAVRTVRVLSTWFMAAIVPGPA